MLFAFQLFGIRHGKPFATAAFAIDGTEKRPWRNAPSSAARTKPTVATDWCGLGELSRFARFGCLSRFVRLVRLIRPARIAQPTRLARLARLPSLSRLFLPKRAPIEQFPPLRFGFVPSKVANSFFAGAPPFAPRPFDTRRSSTFPGRALGLRRWAAAPRTVDEFL